MKQSNTKKLYILAIVALAAAVIIAVCAFAFSGNDKTASEAEPKTTASQEVIEDEEEAEYDEEIEDVDEVELKTDIVKKLYGKKYIDTACYLGTLGEWGRFLTFGNEYVEYSFYNLANDGNFSTNYTVEGDTLSIHIDSSFEEAEIDYKINDLENSCMVEAECKEIYHYKDGDKKSEGKSFLAPEFEGKRGSESIYEVLGNKTWFSSYLSKNGGDGILNISVEGKGDEKSFSGNTKINNKKVDLYGRAFGDNVAYIDYTNDIIVESYEGKVYAYFLDGENGAYTKEVLEKSE